MAAVNKNAYTLITGGTTGIGRELANVFAKAGHNLILVARTESDLETTAREVRSQFGVQVETLSKDLFGEKAATELYQTVQQQGWEVDVLVNDAGQGTYGFFTETPLEDQLKVVHLNIVSLVRLTYHFLRDMQSRGTGKILQLASVVSELPAPYQAVYSGTKAFVLQFTEALISEIKDQKGDITITALQPGATDTDFFNKAGAQDMKMIQDKSNLADPAKVAQDGYDALMAGDDKVVSGLKNKAQVAMSNLMPDTMVADGLKKQSEPVGKEEENKK